MEQAGIEQQDQSAPAGRDTRQRPPSAISGAVVQSHLRTLLPVQAMAAFPAAPSAAQDEVQVFRGATVLPIAGPAIESGVLVVQGGAIVDARLSRPAGPSSSPPCRSSRSSASCPASVSR